MSQFPNEQSHVEQRFIDQLIGMGWQHLRGDTDVPDLTDRESFRDVLLKERLHHAIGTLNTDDKGAIWLDDARINQAIRELELLGTRKLMETNQAATELLLKGTSVEAINGKRNVSVKYIDFDHPERNDFLVISQLRVDPPWATSDSHFIIPDLVLFVNGIPLVVVECKSPATSTDPMEEAITQLLRYSNQRDEVEDAEGAERLFHYNQFMVATSFYDARVGTICASYKHYLAWKDTSPTPISSVATDLGVETLSGQQMLIAGMLRPTYLLDLMQNFIIFKQSGGTTVKVVARYHQFRAVHEAVRRMQHGKTREQDGQQDRRGGIVWHTQGSGKSLTMVFLVRKMRTLPVLQRFKIVIVTDRTDLERQLSDTATLTGERVRRATNAHHLKNLLKQGGADLVFAMVQKYRDTDDAEGEGLDEKTSEAFPVLNTSEEILVLIDEAHRSHSNTLHASMMNALPNSARIGFTGTPIIMGAKKKTHEIFGDYIDRYTIQQSEEDGATVPIIYEGRTVQAEVADGQSLDTLFEEMFHEYSPKELEAIKARYATRGAILAAEDLIATKAADMLRHYISTVIANGFKAMVVADSRFAALRYHEALKQAQQDLVAQLDILDPVLLALSHDELQVYDRGIQFLVTAHQYLDLIRNLEFATVISGNHNDDPGWRQWTDKSRVDARIERFRKPLEKDKLAFLCVQKMLLTGFDAPIAQVLYLDRGMQGHELLQTIARVNRTSTDKACGYIVDYYGLARYLREALSAYSAEDVQGSLISLQDELLRLDMRYQRLHEIFRVRGQDITDIDGTVMLLQDIKLRAEFSVKLKQFLESLDVVMPRPEALPYVRDAKLFGFINKAAANLYRDDQLNIAGVGQKVRRLIDDYVIANGIDPLIPPISIMDADFEHNVASHHSDRAKAAEMEHAASYHINKHYAEDPAYYKKLSERLTELLNQFQDNWTELVNALQKFTHEVQQGRPTDKTSLDPRTQAPFMGVLMEEIQVGGQLTAEEILNVAAFTVEIVNHIRQQISQRDFWRKPHAQNALRNWLVRFLDNHTLHTAELINLERQSFVADRLVDLAKALHTRLTT